MTKSMAEVIRAHQMTTGMQVASGVTCRCGYWTGDETPGVTRPVGFAGLEWHQAQELEAAGFGLVADAKAEALELASEEIDWIRPETGPGINITQYREGRNDAFTSASVWLRARAAKLREPVKPTPEGR